MKQQFDILNKRVVALEMLVRELREQVAKLAEPKPEEPKRGPGRPKKAE